MSTPVDPNAPVAAPAADATAPAVTPAPEAAAAPVAPEKPAPRKLTRTRAEKPVEAPVVAAAKPVLPEERGARAISRLKSEIERNRASVEEAKAYRAELAEYAGQALGGISKEARSYVEKIAGDNPAKQLAALRELRAAGLLGSTANAAAPANSAPRAPAPADAKSGDADGAVLAEYERLRKVAPVIALDYAQRNRDALQRARSRN